MTHSPSLSIYIKTFGTLLALTVLTVLVARWDFGILNTIIAMGIATLKASLVLLYFMHLKYESKLFLVFFLTGVFFLLIIFIFCEIDLLTRIPEKSVL